VSANGPQVGETGLPTHGPGSPASWPRRIAALFLDWAIANVAAVSVAGTSVWQPANGRTWVPLVAWFLLVWLATATTGASLGQWLVGLRVIRLDRRHVGFVRGAVRTALIVLVIPPLISTKDGRGLHDLAVGTAAVNGPGRR
jgi:uncharacterized RDD family membrane protein YckC